MYIEIFLLDTWFVAMAGGAVVLTALLVANRVLAVLDSRRRQFRMRSYIASSKRASGENGRA